MGWGGFPIGKWTSIARNLSNLPLAIAARLCQVWLALLLP